MDIGRRELLTGLAAVAVAGVGPARPISGAFLRERLAPILPDMSSDVFQLMRPILNTATWQYQHIGGFARQGIIRHVATGFTFWTYTAPPAPWQLGDDWNAVQPLFREGDELPADLAAHKAIGHAATYAATIAATIYAGCVYILPPLWDAPEDDAAEVDAPAPPIVAEDFTLS